MLDVLIWSPYNKDLKIRNTFIIPLQEIDK